MLVTTFQEKGIISLTLDKLKHSDQTLAHELRTYRNPRDVGFIDVFDLGAKEVKIGFETTSGTIFEEFEPDTAIAVLVHNFNELPEACKAHCLRTFNSKMSDEIGFFKFSYEITWNEIQDTVDLRLPHVRSWFFECFSRISKKHRQWLLSLSHLPPETTTAYSRFHLLDQLPPQRHTFWEMLPTLLNPDIGGGNPASTGSTISLVAHTLRSAEVATFIYPSARADVSVSFEKGVLVHFEGWNLVDYRDSSPPPGIDFTVFDHSDQRQLFFPVTTIKIPVFIFL